MKQEVSVELAGGKRLSFETGRMAKQASGAALVTSGDTAVLATAVASPDPREGIDFFPLTVDYREYAYAGGRIPGGFIKREGRPSEREILTSRQIDRPIRPLFPEGFRNETQIIALVFSADKENDPDIIGINAAAAALALSDIPFGATIGAVRVGQINGEFVINPSYPERRESKVNITVVGTKDGIVMIESGANEATEETVVEAIEFGHTEIKKIVAAIEDLVARAGKKKRDVKAPEFDQAYFDALETKMGARLKDALDTKAHPKLESQVLVKAIQDELKAEIPDDANAAAAKKKLAHYYEALREKMFREQVTKERIRPDRRAFDEIRAHQHRSGGSAPHPRLGAVYPRRDPGAGDGDPGHDGRLAAPGDLRRRAAQEVHAPLQFPAVLGGRDGPHDRRGTPRSRTRSAGGARHHSQCCRPKSSRPTRCAWCRTFWSRTALRRWPRSAAPAWR